MKYSAALVCLTIFHCTTAHADHLGVKDVANLASSRPTIVEPYGNDPLQFGELRVPAGPGPFPVAMIIHGGCWTKGMGTQIYMAPISSALTNKGVAMWNIEYREVGDPGGGWPGSFQDWGAAADHLRDLAKKYPLDLTRLVAIGHSAGASGALWVAERPTLSSKSEIRGENPIKFVASFAIDGPGDLVAMAKREAAICDKAVIAPFMGGMPEAVPDHYAQGNPISLLPNRTPQILISSSPVLPKEEAEQYQRKASAAGGRVTVLVLENAGHFDMLDPSNKEWLRIEKLILGTVGR